MYKNLLPLFFITLLCGCADAVSFVEAVKMEQVGFWYGLWHGMILPFSFLWSLFDDTVTIYAIYNTGNWYNFGFVLGCGSSSSSTYISTKSTNK